MRTVYRAHDNAHAQINNHAHTQTNSHRYVFANAKTARSLRSPAHFAFSKSSLNQMALGATEKAVQRPYTNPGTLPAGNPGKRTTRRAKRTPWSYQPGRRRAPPGLAAENPELSKVTPTCREFTANSTVKSTVYANRHKPLAGPFEMHLAFLSSLSTT